MNIGIIVVVLMVAVFSVIDFCAVTTLIRNLDELEQEVDILWREAHRK